MASPTAFVSALETKVFEQLSSQRVGYLLGAGSGYLNGKGYPLASQIWSHIKLHIADTIGRDEIQAKLDTTASGLEDALDQLDDGSPTGCAHRSLVTEAVAQCFKSLSPPLDTHTEFLTRLKSKENRLTKIFTLNYDPLLERAAETARVRLYDGFCGHEHAYFDPSLFEERILRIRGTHKGLQWEETTKPIHLIKLHGSLGWYESGSTGPRRCGFACDIPYAAKRLMIPPHWRKANDTMSHPFSQLWSTFRGSLGQDAVPLNRLACFGYGFLDEHVNAVIEPALSRSNFTLLIFAEALSDTAWTRWSVQKNAVVVTRLRCSLKGEIGPGHPDLWRFEKMAKEV
jgi:hypothetical protein